jgi:CRISPR-associated protein Cas2
MELLVSYDINTETPEGQRRLREVAKICEGFGQRVQKSVFECQLEPQQVRRLAHALRSTIDPTTDRVAIYRLREPYVRYVTLIGQGPSLDWRRPIIL